MPTPEPGRPRDYGDIATSRALARVMDDLVKIPGTDIGVGLDALIGLVPGIGDAVGTGLSGAIMVDAVRQRVPLHVLARMGFNLLLDTGLGFIPGIGDVADVAHRANRKNYRLLEQCVRDNRHVNTDVRGYLVRAVAMVVAFLAVAIAAVIFILWGILRLLGVIG
ncbi:DUF4112 domain-containing protein [Nigerium massiliense]|uniref:DUF4112 domain-containing protein n=1 Tax=Nigerium massiliense TaxID=1522317 RepID=UPI0009078776|nr:DUF4112 domain-containing protein [Nigerium massiliense]